MPALAAKPKDGLFVAPKGKVELGYDLEFKVSAGGTKITKLVANVLENCDGESTSSVTTLGPRLTWKVKNGRFSGRQKETYDGVTVYTTLEGSFKSREQGGRDRAPGDDRRRLGLRHLRARLHRDAAVAVSALRRRTSATTASKRSRSRIAPSRRIESGAARIRRLQST